MHEKEEINTDKAFTDTTSIEGVIAPIGGTVRGDAARACVAAHAEAHGLRYLSAIGAGKFTISTGISPTRIVALMPRSPRARRREIWVLLPSGEAWLHAGISPAAAACIERLQAAGAAGVNAAGRRAHAAGAAIDWTRRITDLRAVGAVISVSQIGDLQTATRLHAIVVFDPPTDGRPVIEAKRIARLAHPEAAIEQARHAHDKCGRQIGALIEQGELLGHGAALRQRLASEGLLPASAEAPAAA